MTGSAAADIMILELKKNTAMAMTGLTFAVCAHNGRGFYRWDPGPKEREPTWLKGFRPANGAILELRLIPGAARGVTAQESGVLAVFVKMQARRKLGGTTEAYAAFVPGGAEVFCFLVRFFESECKRSDGG